MANKPFIAHVKDFIALIFICIFLTGITCAQPSADLNETELPVSTSGVNGTSISKSSFLLTDKIAQLTSFVKKGVAFAKNESKKNALATFNDLNGEFIQGELYLFAYDVNATTLALPYQQEIIGQNRMVLRDSNGMGFIKAMTNIAGYGGGFVYYVYPNPVMNLTEQVKLAYVKPVDETWFIGSGIYLPEIHAFMDKDAISQLINRVEQAAAFAMQEGKEKATTDFNNKNGTWAQNNTYIFAYDFNGTTLAMPYQPESIGTDRWDYTDKYGSLIARIEIDTAQDGGGFVYVVYYNPETEKDELKLCYVLPIDNRWLVGSGIYTGQDLLT
jgi:signal transduction histidine kinase